MKRIFFLLLISISVSNLFAQTANDVVKFEKMVYDFGKIKQGVPVNYNFAFKNISKTPITVESATASCGCTTPTWPKVPVMVGKSNKINAGFNAANAGPFEKTITIKIQGAATPVEIKIKGEVLSEADYAKISKGKKV
jgi:Protein of unknown function (DUF1573)